MIPLSKKLETYHPKGDGHNESQHGYDGPISISDGGYRGQSENQFIETVKSMGHKEIIDLQDFDANGGFAKWHRYVSPDGKLF